MLSSFVAHCVEPAITLLSQSSVSTAHSDATQSTWRPSDSSSCTCFEDSQGHIFGTSPYLSPVARCSRRDLPKSPSTPGPMPAYQCRSLRISPPPYATDRQDPPPSYAAVAAEQSQPLPNYRASPEPATTLHTSAEPPPFRPILSSQTSPGNGILIVNVRSPADSDVVVDIPYDTSSPAVSSERRPLLPHNDVDVRVIYDSIVLPSRVRIVHTRGVRCPSRTVLPEPVTACHQTSSGDETRIPPPVVVMGLIALTYIAWVIGVVIVPECTEAIC